MGEVGLTPSEALKATLVARGMSQSDLARAMGFSYAYVSLLCLGKKGISVTVAVRLEDVLGIPAIFWLRLEAQHQLDRFRESR